MLPFRSKVWAQNLSQWRHFEQKHAYMYSFSDKMVPHAAHFLKIAVELYNFVQNFCAFFVNITSLNVGRPVLPQAHPQGSDQSVVILQILIIFRTAKTI